MNMRSVLPVSLFMLLAACGGQTASSAAQSSRLVLGEPAPAFEAPDQDGVVRSLAEMQGKFVVLYFYPRDATPGCTREACAFRDIWSRFEAANAMVVGVSTDDSESHARFANEYNLPFPLLADTDEAIADAFGVTVRLGFAERVTFLIDPEGRVRHVFESVDPGVHAEEVLARISELQAGQ